MKIPYYFTIVIIAIVYFRTRVTSYKVTKFSDTIKILIKVCFYLGYPGGVKPPKYGKKNLKTTSHIMKVSGSIHQKQDSLYVIPPNHFLQFFVRNSEAYIVPPVYSLPVVFSQLGIPGTPPNGDSLNRCLNHLSWLLRYKGAEVLFWATSECLRSWPHFKLI